MITDQMNKEAGEGGGKGMQRFPAMSYQMISHSFSQHQTKVESEIKEITFNNSISDRPE